MNERIKKLKEQATSYTWNGNDVNEELDEIGYFFDVEKFAELIVRECSQMAFNSHRDDLPFVSGKMLEHFGVDL